MVIVFVSATLEKNIKTKKLQKNEKTKTRKRVLYCDVRAVSHSCDVFMKNVNLSGENLGVGGWEGSAVEEKVQKGAKTTTIMIMLMVVDQTV